MSGTVNCPSCAAKLRAPESTAGGKIKCPKCGNPVVVPSSSQRNAIRAGTPPVRPPPAPLPDRTASEASPFQDLSLPVLSSDRRRSNLGLWIGLGAVGFLALLVAVTLWTTGILSNTKLTKKQRADLENAIKSLERIKAAVEVGVLFQRYSDLVIDAKAAVNEAEATLPAGKLLSNLREAMDAYKDATKVFNHKIQIRPGLNFTFDDREIITKYKLVFWPGEATSVGNVPEEAYTETALQRIWAIAGRKLAVAKNLADGRENHEPPAESNADAVAGPKQLAPLTTTDRKEPKAADDVERLPKAEAQKKATAWLQDCKARLLKNQQAAEAAKTAVREAREQADTANEEAERASEQVNKDERNYRSARATARFYQEYMEEDRKLAHSKEFAKKRRNEAQKAARDLQEAEEASREAGAAVVVAQAAVRQAEAVCYSLGAAIETPPAGNSPSVAPATPKAQSTDFFVGRWRIVDDKGATSTFFDLTRSLQAKKSHSPRVTAKWEIIGNEARITWSDGWKDILRPQGNRVVKIAFGPGATWDDAPANTQRAIKER